MNPLSNKRVYLSAPLEFMTLNPSWRLEVKAVLQQHFQLNVFDPADDPKQQYTPELAIYRENGEYDKVRDIVRGYVKKDLGTVDRCDALLAFLPHKVPTTGVVHEIINANNAKKPTLLVCPEGKNKISFWYYGFIPHRYMFGSWDALYNYLNEVNTGKHIDDDRWAFVYETV